MGSTTTTNDLVPRLRLGVMRLARRLRQQNVGDVTASMLSALSSIDHNRGVTLGALATIERVSPPSMTRIVARLEEHALVTREVDAGDRRVARVSITAEGEKLLQQNRTKKDAYLAQRIAALSAEDRRVLRDAMPVIERLVADE